MITAPSTFRVIALISTYNEEDIIVPVVKHLINEGISVYIIDNWSTDRTWELVNEHSSSLIGLERFPKDKPSPTYDWEDILERKEELSLSLNANWFMHHDADEIRESPWPGISLKDAIFVVDQNGYNAIDFELLNFHPVDNNYKIGIDPKQYFQYYMLNESNFNKSQIKAWKKTDEQIQFAKSGGHFVEFVGRRIFPYKFIMRHYPIRSQDHGVNKVFSEREPRFNPKEKQKGWHIQYDNLQPKSNFLKDPAILTKFTENLYQELIIQRILEREKEVRQIEGISVEQEQTIQQLSNVLNERDQSIQQITHDLGEREQSIQKLTTELAERDQSIQQLTTDLAEREQSIQQLTTELAERDQEILFYVLSKSWRITRPFRKVMKLIRGK